MFWSSPVRKSGTVDLSPIPNEIYLEIFGYLRPIDPNEWIDAEARQHFCNLALVCRFFSSVMLPWIFENLTFVEKNAYSQISSTLSSTVSAKFCRSILDGDTMALLLAKHVKRWAFSGSPTQSKWTPAFLSMYFETFQHLSNLLELSLSNIVIPKDFFKRLANIPTLEAIKLEDSSFDEEVREKHLKHFESLSLKRLALVQLGSSDLVRLVPHLNMSSLIRLELGLLGLEELPPSHCSLPLEYIYLYGVRQPVGVEDFLENTPYLKVLRLRWAFRLRRFVLKPHAVPQLSQLGGHWSTCTRILPGRPISHVELFSLPIEVEKDQWKMLTGSTKSLIELKMPSFQPCADLAFWEHFPDLENLEIQPLSLGQAWGEIVSSLFKKCNLLNLRSLGLVFPAISSPEIDSEETQVLEFLNGTFPVLTSVELSFLRSLHLDSDSSYDTWNYTRVVSGSWHRTFRISKPSSSL